MTGLRENMARLAASYDGDSILNLVASIERSCGGESAFAKASLLDEADLSKSQHLVLFVLDGMGDQLLHRYGHPSGLLCSHRLGTLSSVFPTTTSAAISTLLTGYPPAQHGILAWHMHLPNGVYTTLLAKYREDPRQASPDEHTLFRATPLFSRLTRDKFNPAISSTRHFRFVTVARPARVPPTTSTSYSVRSRTSPTAHAAPSPTHTGPNWMPWATSTASRARTGARRCNTSSAASHNC